MAPEPVWSIQKEWGGLGPVSDIPGWGQFFTVS